MAGGPQAISGRFESGPLVSRAVGVALSALLSTSQMQFRSLTLFGQGVLVCKAARPQYK